MEKLKQEYWLSIPNFKNYLVSNLGNVKNKVTNKIVRGYTSNKYRYVRYSLKRDKKYKFIYGHQLVAMAFLNHKPNGHKKVVDHIDNNPLNNNVDNLQVVSNRVNTSKNRKGTSAYTGVCFDKQTNKYIASININGKSIKLGRFDNEKEAHIYYKKSLSRHELGLDIIKKKSIFSSNYKGVSYCNTWKKWKARIMFNKVNYNLGYFNDEKLAHNAYINKKKELLNKV